MDDEWFDIKDKLPEIGQRVKAFICEELIYAGNPDDLGHFWTYDQQGEHKVYSWSPNVQS